MVDNNKTLKSALESCAKKPDQQRTEELWNLYRQFYIQDHDSLDTIRDGLRHIINNIQGNFEQSDGKLSNYVTSLHDFVGILNSSAPPDQMKAEVEKVIQYTRTTELSQREFENQLTHMAEEVEVLRKELAQSKQESLKDSLTGIFNRRAFDNALEQIIQTNHETSSSFCLLMADIDHFKKVNDTYGHLVGDKVIRFVASTLKHCTKENDLPARYGGEEFALILPETNLADAAIIAENIRKKISSGKLKNTQNGKTYGKVTISIGIAQFQKNDLSELLIERADKALYQAKENGRNRIEKAA